MRSCIKHPIANYVGYSKLSPQFKAFTASIDELEIPKDIHHALQNEKWKEAVMNEMQALEANGTWDIVKLLVGKKVVVSKWVFIVKYQSNGSINRYKARLVAKGFTQT